ncbi:MAG: hypothetical protein WAO71_01205, partial [Gallionella sp.]
QTLGLGLAGAITCAAVPIARDPGLGRVLRIGVAVLRQAVQRVKRLRATRGGVGADLSARFFVYKSTSCE